MKKNLSLWQFAGFALTSFFGSLLHFLYDWSGMSPLVAPFSAVNESTWEHMKLLFFPLFLFACLQFFFFKDIKSFWCIKLRGILLGLLLIPSIFYTLNGIFGKTADFVNISIFFVTAALVFIYESKSFKKDVECKNPLVPFLTISAIGMLFVIFTFATPELAIFRDPLSGSFGV